MPNDVPSGAPVGEEKPSPTELSFATKIVPSDATASELGFKIGCDAVDGIVSAVAWFENGGSKRRTVLLALFATYGRPAASSASADGLWKFEDGCPIVTSSPPDVYGAGYRLRPPPL